MPAPLDIRVDDLTSEASIGLVRQHLAGMHAQTPAESVHALDVAGLRHPSVTVWSAWRDGEIAGIGALARLGDEDGELKSMRVVDAHLGTGVGRAILRHILEAARAAGLTRVWLETGSDAPFLAARTLYASEGFDECAPFGSYRPDPASTFMTRAL
ncbi:GNAT family N-acetyltransferase [Microbacterium oleivorans]|uniref:GNAT family N-acetyltransferase n=1 Tax=Microbacterium oleivorans TaxID=273677 RepID=UPI0020419A6C|nr:GNAT family N-acetyltransferase [Microbacterium oleivorans]MCM3697358.1 GNAT family N-acetyltransferase [Microbacterium oleivorans]